MLKFAPHAQTHMPSLHVLEQTGFVQAVSVDFRSTTRRPARLENKRRCLVQKRLPSGMIQSISLQVRPDRTAGRFHNAPMHDRAHLRLLFRRLGGGVVPEIHALTLRN